MSYWLLGSKLITRTELSSVCNLNFSEILFSYTIVNLPFHWSQTAMPRRLGISYDSKARARTTTESPPIPNRWSGSAGEHKDHMRKLSTEMPTSGVLFAETEDCKLLLLLMLFLFWSLLALFVNMLTGYVFCCDVWFIISVFMFSLSSVYLFFIFCVFTKKVPNNYIEIYQNWLININYQRNRQFNFILNLQNSSAFWMRNK